MSKYTDMRSYFHHDPEEKFQVLQHEMLPKIRELHQILSQTHEIIPPHLSDMVNMIHINAIKTSTMIDTTFPQWLHGSTNHEVITENNLQGLRHDIIAPVMAMYDAAHILQQRSAIQLSEEGQAVLQKVIEITVDLLSVLEALTNPHVPERLK